MPNRVIAKQTGRPDMKTLGLKASMIAAGLLLVLGANRADAFWGHYRAATAYSMPSVPVAVGYAPVAVARPVVVASPIVAAPVVTSPVVTASYAPATTTYYAPATTAYYAPATTAYYAPATTAYYAPAT